MAPPDMGQLTYTSNTPAHTNAYLLPVVRRLLRSAPPPARVFDLGCGNGTIAHEIATLGYEVTAIDPSVDGIRIATESFSDCRFAVGSAYDDLSIYGSFDVLISLEVVEHLFYPGRYARTIADLLKPQGIAIISTPYHGYIKNLALSIFNKWEAHHDPLWEGGHIKFWTRPKLVRLFEEVGLYENSFHRVGRIPPLAMGMVVSFKKRA
ncbi:MAG TPA: class I SAM-dependent methyltransferase [Pyrinomonadaceae bacterium]|jgi:2-polyprenyl-6-hydroxyphenyl methylase/3-demethylubiquinone-9 3-methyltransferase|nr:class I SAM-dependent methyltransferase [Pyrinomonadaceae bacterium]